MEQHDGRSTGIWLGACLALLVAGLGGWQWVRANTARQQAEIARSLAEIENAEAAVRAMPGPPEDAPVPAPGEWQAVMPRELAESSLRIARAALADGDLATARQNLSMVQMMLAAHSK